MKELTSARREELDDIRLGIASVGKEVRRTLFPFTGMESVTVVVVGAMGSDRDWNKTGGRGGDGSGGGGSADAR